MGPLKSATVAAAVLTPHEDHDEVPHDSRSTHGVFYLIFGGSHGVTGFFIGRDLIFGGAGTEVSTGLLSGVGEFPHR